MSGKRLMVEWPFTTFFGKRDFSIHARLQTNLEQLPLHQVEERAVLSRQLLIRSSLDDTAGLQHENAVGVRHGAEAVSDGEARRLQLVQAAADDRLRAVVEGARRF